MLDAALDDTQGPPEITPAFLRAFDASIPFDTNPLYAVIHETCYTRGAATRWAAQRARDSHFAAAFDPEVRRAPAQAPARSATRARACARVSYP